MSDTTSNIIKITGILNKYAWQNHELLPEELFQLLADRKVLNDANRKRISEILKPMEEDATLQSKKYLKDCKKYLGNFILNEFTEAWHFPVTAGDISAIVGKEMKDKITDETINETLRKVIFSNALKTQEYRVKAVNAAVLKRWAEMEQNIAGKIAACWAAIIKDCLCAVKACVNEECYSSLKNIMPSRELKEAKSVVEIHDFLRRITDNEIQRNKLKQQIKVLRRTGKVTEAAEKTMEELLGDTLSYIDILTEEHLQEGREAFKIQNRIEHERFLDTWFLRNKNIYRKNDIKDKTLWAGFAGEEDMKKSDRDKLYTPAFINKLLRVARENDIDLTDSYLPNFTPNHEDFAKILKNGAAPEKDYIAECGERALDEFRQHLNEIAPEIKEAAKIFAQEDALVFLSFLFRKLNSLWLQCSYHSSFYWFYLPKLGVSSNDQYFYYLIRGSELPDKDRVLLLNALATGIPDKKVRRRIQSFIGKDLSLSRKNEEPDYNEQIILEQKEETANDLSNLLDQIDRAIRSKDKLKFEYGYIDPDGNRVMKQRMNQHGEFKNIVYSVFPFGTVYQSGYFYMLAFFENDDADFQFVPYTFRIDLMDNVQIKAFRGTPWDIKQIKSFEDWERFDPARYAKKHPHMYGEEKEENAEGNENNSAKIIFRVKGNYVRYFRSAFGEDNCKVIYAIKKEMPAQAKDAGKVEEKNKDITVAPSIKTKQKAPGAKESNADKDVVIELNTSLGEAKIFALQYAPYCQVMSPGDLVREVKESFRKVAGNYGLDWAELLRNRNMEAVTYELANKNKQLKF